MPFTNRSQTGKNAGKKEHDDLWSEEHAEMERKLKMLSEKEIKAVIPRNLQFIKNLQNGGFGQVVECRTRETKEKVAVKLPYFHQNNKEELDLLCRVRDEGMYQRNIVKFFESFDTRLGKGMVFEMLDTDLYHYYNEYAPLSMSDIRSIVKQVATALVVLKDWSIIHADLKLDNVMVYNRTQRPVQVKIIDLGIAFPVSKATTGMTLHHVCYRPPEILLGLPFNEAMDVWNLGTIMAYLMLGCDLFPNRTEYETYKVIVKLIGEPSRLWLSLALRSKLFYNRVGHNWTLMSDEEVASWLNCEIEEYFSERYNSLKELMKDKFELSNLADNREVQAATLLLIRMLVVDVAHRITPSEILKHHFICDESGEISPAISTKPAEGTTTGHVSSCNDEHLTHEEIMDILPEGYKVQKLLGNGTFGQLVKCEQLVSSKMVSIKLPNANNRTEREIELLKRFAENETAGNYIVRFLDTLQTSRGDVLLLENLNMGLPEYLHEHYPSKALVFLKPKGLIHTGVMMENIWVCSRNTEPIKVKLADFGAVIRRKKAVQGKTIQLVHYRAPEIIIGLPFDQAIDVWSLGYMLVTMLIKIDMFSTKSEFQNLKTMIQFFGQPSDDILDDGAKTMKLFNLVRGRYKLKSAQEFEKSASLPPNTIEENYTDCYDSLEELLQFFVPDDYKKDKLEECVHLVKKMLTMDRNQRITPVQILKHNFICLERNARDHGGREESMHKKPPRKLSPLILVKPAQSKNITTCLDEGEYLQKEQLEPVQKQPKKLPPLILVKPAQSKNNTPCLDEGEYLQKEQSEPVQKPPKKLPPLILVKSNQPKNIEPCLDEGESLQIKQSEPLQKPPKKLPPLILVKSNRPKNNEPCLDKGESLQKEQADPFQTSHKRSHPEGEFLQKEQAEPIRKSSRKKPPRKTPPRKTPPRETPPRKTPPRKLPPLILVKSNQPKNIEPCLDEGESLQKEQADPFQTSHRKKPPRNVPPLNLSPRKTPPRKTPPRKTPPQKLPPLILVKSNQPKNIEPCLDEGEHLQKEQAEPIRKSPIKKSHRKTPPRKTSPRKPPPLILVKSGQPEIIAPCVDEGESSQKEQAERVQKIPRKKLHRKIPTPPILVKSDQPENIEPCVDEGENLQKEQAEPIRNSPIKKSYRKTPPRKTSPRKPPPLILVKSDQPENTEPCVDEKNLHRKSKLNGSRKYPERSHSENQPENIEPSVDEKESLQKEQTERVQKIPRKKPHRKLPSPPILVKSDQPENIAPCLDEEQSPQKEKAESVQKSPTKLPELPKALQTETSDPVEEEKESQKCDKAKKKGKKWNWKNKVHPVSESPNKEITELKDSNNTSTTICPCGSSVHKDCAPFRMLEISGHGPKRAKKLQWSTTHILQHSEAAHVEVFQPVSVGKVELTPVRKVRTVGPQTHGVQPITFVLGEAKSLNTFPAWFIHRGAIDWSSFSIASSCRLALFLLNQNVPFPQSERPSLSLTLTGTPGRLALLLPGSQHLLLRKGETQPRHIFWSLT
ncbi:hypothetical protein WMY93_014452 [Mugilogobius chulae]|uniref:Protein kinase domain-containing protein n=1 Tax=Mugilogobius chulae TaxID=88201 RepID=A0AAW0P5C6_9GOBI